MENLEKVKNSLFNSVGLKLALIVILQLANYSLIIGNIGLVIILGLVMYFSRKIDWYSPVKSNPSTE